MQVEPRRVFVHLDVCATTAHTSTLVPRVSPTRVIIANAAGQVPAPFMEASLTNGYGDVVKDYSE